MERFDRKYIAGGLILAVLLAALVLATPAFGLSERTQVFYYQWYETPEFFGIWDHWPSYLHCPWDSDLSAAYCPQLGGYSSRDVSVIRQHMQWMKDAGIGCIILDWWGQSSISYVGGQVMDIANEYGIKCCWMLEPAVPPALMKAELCSVLDRYGSRPNVYRDATKGNRPVFYIWAMGSWTDTEWRTQWDSIRGTSYDSIVMANSYNHSQVLNGHWDGFYNYHHGQEIANWPSHASWAQTNGKIFAPPVGPGWDNSAIAPPGVYWIEPRNDGAVYDSEWSTAYNLSKTYSALRYVCVPTFNEWHEGTQIEPASPMTTFGRVYADYSPNVPTMYIDKTTSWTAMFEPTVSGIVQCEDYSGGAGAAEGVDYHDTTAGNSGGQYRTQNVDITTCCEGGYYIGWVTAGEWLRYTNVSVATTGTQEIRLRASAWTGTKPVRICDGTRTNTILTLNVPNTGGAEKWRTVSGQVTMTAGTHTIYLVMDQADVNLNWFQIRSVGDTTPPDAITNLAAAAGDGEIALSWTNPSNGDLSGTVIAYRTDRYPLSRNDGTLACNKTGVAGAPDSFTLAGLSSSTLYYFTAFACDTIGNTSAGCQTAQMPSGAYCFADGFAYPGGALVGQGNWTGTATSSQIEAVGSFVRVWGGGTSYYAQKTANCADTGSGYIWVRCKIYKGQGTNTMWNVWVNDSSGKNFGRWYGSGTTARGRIGVTGSVTAVQNLTGNWDSIDMKIYPSSNNTEFFFNGVSLGTLSHSSQGTGNVVGQIKIERENNNQANGNFMYLDDIRIGDPVTDTTPPGPVGWLNATANHGEDLCIMWTNPTDADWVGTLIRYRTDAFPTGPTDGTLLHKGRESSWDHTCLNQGLTYYYAAYTYDEMNNYSSATLMSSTGFCFRDTFPYGDGNLNGFGLWMGSATSAAVGIATGVVNVFGGAGSNDCVRYVYCTDPGTGVMWVRAKVRSGVGADTIWSLWINDGLGRNLARWYGSGTTARGRIGGTFNVTSVQNLTGNWDTIDVKITPLADTSEFFFNSVSIGTLNHSSEGAGNEIQQLRFERLDNYAAVGQYAQLDDLRVGGF